MTRRCVFDAVTCVAWSWFPGRFTATCSSVAFAWASPTREGDRGELQNVQADNETFFEAAKAGEFELETQRANWFRSHMVGSGPSMDQMALKAGISMDELHDKTDRFLTSVCVTKNWDRLMERGVDVLFEPGTHDWVAYDILWGAQNHPQLPVYYAPNGGHEMQKHPAAESDENLEAFLWNHFFGGEPLLSPPASSHEVIGDKLKIHVRFDNGPQAESGRIWWMYDRAPAGSAPFLHVRIPEDQWADMERDPKTGAWTATIPLKDGFDRIDFFSNHGHMANGYKHYLSSPYTRVELSAATAKIPAATDLRSHGVTQKQLESLSEILRQAVDQEQIAGGSFLVAHKGEFIFREAFGYADIESNRPFTTDELHPIASVSKPFMASVVMALVEKRKLNLDETIELVAEYDLVYNGKRILSEESVSEMRRLRSPDRPQRTYGLGWFRDDVSESGLADLVFHSGALGARLRIDRSREVVCVFLVHQSSAQTVEQPNKLFELVDEMFSAKNDR